MSRLDIRPSARGIAAIPTRTFQVASGAAASIKAGEPVALGATVGASQFVALAADADPVTPSSATRVLVGIASSDSTDSTTAAGTVEVYLPIPGTVWRSKTKSTAAADTQSEINALCNTRRVWDLTASVWTVDDTTADAITSGLMIVSPGDPSGSYVDYIISLQATILAY